MSQITKEERDRLRQTVEDKAQEIKDLQQKIRALRNDIGIAARLAHDFDEEQKINRRIRKLAVHDDLRDLAKRVVERGLKVARMRDAKYSRMSWRYLYRFVNQGKMPAHYRDKRGHGYMDGSTVSDWVTYWCQKVMAEDTAQKSRALVEQVDAAREEVIGEE